MEPKEVILVESEADNEDRLVLLSPLQVFRFHLNSVRPWCVQNGILPSPEADGEYKIRLTSLSEWALFFGKWFRPHNLLLEEEALQLRRAEQLRGKLMDVQLDASTLLKEVHPFDAGMRKHRDHVVESLEHAISAVSEFISATSRRVQEVLDRDT